jgi:hypothetical protein
MKILLLGTLLTMSFNLFALGEGKTPGDADFCKDDKVAGEALDGEGATKKAQSTQAISDCPNGVDTAGKCL